MRSFFLLLCVWAILCPVCEALANGIGLPKGFPPPRRPTQSIITPPYLEHPPAVIPIDLGRQLFVDGFLVKHTTLRQVWHRPTLYDKNPVLQSGEYPDAKQLAMPFSDGVWFDPAMRLFRMWYHGGLGNTLSYAFSDNGKDWIRPSLPEAPFPGTNMVLKLGGGRDSATVWMDQEDPDPSRRFKLFAYAGGGQLKIYYSPNGLKWREDTGNLMNSLSDRTTVFWNPFRQVWVNSARSRTVLPPEGDAPQRLARARFYSESRDLQSWSPADPSETFWVGPDTADPPYSAKYPGLPELYNLDAVAYESLLVGLFSWFYPPPGPDVVQIGVGFSRDGFHWHRPDRLGVGRAFIEPQGKPDTWNAYNVQSAGGGFLVVDDKLWFYFSARDSRHAEKSQATATGLAFLRRDGFASMEASGEGGVLTTRPVRFSKKYLFVNSDASKGKLTVEILDERGDVIEGFSSAECIPTRSDKTLQRVRWRRFEDLSRFAQQPVTFRFHLTNGKLYSFWVSDDPNGASGGYVAAGGPGFIGPRDLGPRPRVRN